MTTSIVWPVSLPCFRFEPYNVAPRPGSTEMTLGMVTRRAMVYQENNEVVSVEMVLTAAQEQALRTFFKTTTSMGTQSFLVDLLMAGTYEEREANFYGAPPTFTPVAPNVVRTAFTLLSRIPIPAPEPPTPFACEEASSGSYLVSPAWVAYPTGYTESAPLAIDPYTGRVTFITNKIEYGVGESPLPPLTLSVSFDTAIYEHAGTFVGAGETIDISIDAPDPGVWNNGTLRQFNIELTPVQFSQGLFIALRRGYASVGFTAWFTSGLATEAEGYLGDFESYSPAAYGGARGDTFEAARAKYWNDNVYIQLGTGPSSITSTVMRISAPGGSAPVPSSSGGSYSGEDLFTDPVSRTFAQVIQDIACDTATGFIYVMRRDSSSLFTVTIERINPTTLATIESWTKVDYFEEAAAGFSVNGSRVVLGSDISGSGSQRYYVMDLNGSGGMDLVHNGLNEIDPGNVLSGAYVFADPVCGFLKAKNRWISSDIGV